MLEIGAAHLPVDDAVGQTQLYLHDLVRRQQFLRPSALEAQRGRRLLPEELVGHLEVLPDVGVELFADVVHEQFVEQLAAEVRIADRASDDDECIALGTQGHTVERAAAEVVHEHVRAVDDRHIGGVGDGCRDRFGHERRVGEPGPRGRSHQILTARRAP